MKLAAPSLLKRVSRAVGAKALHDALTPDERLALRYCWAANARPLERLPSGEYRGQTTPPGDWSVHMVLAGRGSGKTKTAAEWCREKAEQNPGCRIGLVGRTAPDTRKVMVFGDSGIMACCPPWNRPHFNVTDQCLEWRNGSTAWLYSADKPDQFRGPQHAFAWADEVASWRRLKDAWDNLKMGLRLGAKPQVMITTTPRPLKLLSDFRKRALDGDPSVVVSRGSTWDNLDNLPEDFLLEMERQYSGTALGRQELEGDLLEEAEGSLWRREWFDKHRVATAQGKFKRIVIGVDPAEGGEYSDETGIVAAGLGEDGRVYVFADCTLLDSPDAWARKVVEVYRRHEADCVVVETTRGGELVTSCLRLVDPTIKIKAKGGNKGKRGRAEPVSALYEQGRVSHVGSLAELEDQMASWSEACTWSPDRLDACVYAVAELMLGTIPTHTRPTTSIPRRSLT